MYGYSSIGGTPAAGSNPYRVTDFSWAPNTPNGSLQATTMMSLLRQAFTFPVIAIKNNQALLVQGEQLYRLVPNWGDNEKRRRIPGLMIKDPVSLGE